MIKKLFFSIFLRGGMVILAQNYYLQFNATGATQILDSVYVENITQCTKLCLKGSDILHLTGNVNIENFYNERIKAYPSPCNGVVNLQLNGLQGKNVNLEIYSIFGQPIYSEQINVTANHQTYELRGLPFGMFYLNVETSKGRYCQQILSLTTKNEGIVSKIILYDKNEIRESEEKNIVSMYYNQGDILKCLGKSGAYKTIVMIKPMQDQTVTFEFIPCIDDDGNSYSIVKIGNHWWMAENLNVGDYMPITNSQPWRKKFCMNVNGEEDPNCPMGGLYEWENLMQGAQPCNGSGPYPHDRCNQPIRGLCPYGWHIPSHYEWTTLVNELGGNFMYDATVTISPSGGGDLKLNCTDYWWSPNAGATNSSGFSALPGGDTWHGLFEDYGQSAYFWTSTAVFTYTYNPWVYALNYSLPSVGRSFYFKEHGFSCRCVKD